MVQMTVDIWVTAILVLMMMSFMIKETAFYRFGEYTLIGASGGMVLLGAYKRIMGSAITPILEGNYIYIIGIVLGATTLLRFRKEYAWISRYAVSNMIGLGVGILIPTMAESDILEQVRDTILGIPLNEPLSAFNNLVTIVVVLSVVWFFVFTREPKNPLEDKIRYFARQTLFVAFGVGIGSHIMEYAARALTALQLVLSEWLQIALVEILTNLL